MNREERYTTVTLTINGESAKKTLDELNARAEALGVRIAALKSATPAVSGDGQKVGDTTAEVKRLERELAAVMSDIEKIESGSEQVASVMGGILNDVEKREGLRLVGDIFKLPEWYKNKHRDKGINMGGMSVKEAAELYRILTDIYKSGVWRAERGEGQKLDETSNKSGMWRAESGKGGKSDEYDERNEGDERGAWKIDGGVIKVEMVNGDVLEIKDEKQLEQLMEELMSQMTDYKRLSADWLEKGGRARAMKPDKYRAENDWKLGKDAENFIAMSTGTIDYKQYLDRAREIEEDYLRMKIANNKSTEAEIYEFRNELFNLQVKGYRLEVKEENKIRTEAEKEELRVKRDEVREESERRKKEIEKQYQEGLIGYKAYQEAMLRADVDYYEEVKKYYPKNSPFLFQIERNLYGKLQQERDRKAESFKNTQETMRSTYFKDSESRDVATIKDDFDERARALDVLYQNMVELAKGDAGKLKSITKAYKQAKRQEEVSRAKALGEDIKLTWREEIEQFMGWLDSDAGKKIMQTVGNITSSMSSIFHSVMQMAQIECEIQVGLIEQRYKKEISFAEGNSYRVKKLEKQRNKEIAKEKRKATEKTYALQVMMAIASTAQNAITAYGDGLQIGGLAGLILAPIAATMATAAGMVQIAVIKKQKEAAMSAEYADGGFTPDGPKKKAVGVVHAGEWVASQRLVRSPKTRPLIEALDYAQRTNTIGKLNAADVSRSITAPILLATRQQTSKNVDSQPAPTVIVEQNSEFVETMKRLSQRLDEPFVTVATITGDKGINKAQEDYERLIRNKSPKAKVRG